MQVGTTKDQGLYNKPSDVVHPGALAAGTLSQYNKWEDNIKTDLKEKRGRFIASAVRTWCLISYTLLSALPGQGPPQDLPAVKKRDLTVWTVPN